jgi:hypothetical protein
MRPAVQFGKEGRNAVFPALSSPPPLMHHPFPHPQHKTDRQWDDQRKESSRMGPISTTAIHRTKLLIHVFISFQTTNDVYYAVRMCKDCGFSKEILWKLDIVKARR